MSSIALDLMHLNKKFKEAKFTEEQAEIICEALGNVMADIEISEFKLEKTENTLSRDIKEAETNLSNKIDLKFSQQKSELILWMFGMFAGQAALFFGFIKYIH